MTEPRANSVLKMNEDKTLEFLSLYESEPCLWNTTFEFFRHKAERARAAQRVAVALDIPNFEAHHVIIKFKNLRNAYCQELKKLAGSMSLGVEYKPKVVWFKKMDSFLRPHLSKTNVGQIVDYNSSVVNNVESIKEEEWRNSVDESHQFLEETALDFASDDGNSTISMLEPMNKRPRVGEEIDPLSTERPKDYFDDFGRYIASLLRSLPKKRSLALQPQIINIITASALAENGINHL